MVRIIAEDFEANGVYIKPLYDMYVANKLINVKQCTLVWHVDDDKLSHVEEKVVTEMLEILMEI